MATDPAEAAAARIFPLLEDSAEDLFDNAPCGYLSTLADGLVVKVNQTFLTWTGYERDELVGRRRFQDLLTAGGRIFHETHYRPLLLMQGSVREIAVELLRAEGGTLPALINSVVRHDGAGRPAVVRTTVFDATDRRRYEQELLRARRAAEDSEERARLLAQTLQESLIPPILPTIRDVEVAGIYRPAGRGDEVGGDFYDVFEVGPGDWAIAIGDVRGKGAQAAVVTGTVRHTLRAAAVRSTRTDVGLKLVNEVLVRQRATRFCSIVYGRLRRDPAGRFTVTVSSAGHPLPLLAGSDGVRTVGEPGTLAGVLERPRLEVSSVGLAPGDVLLLYTDGVPEGRRDGEFYGDERLASLLASLRGADARTVAERISDDVVAFQDGMPADDIALAVLKVR